MRLPRPVRRVIMDRRISQLAFVAGVFVLTLFYLRKSYPALGLDQSLATSFRSEVHFRPSGFDWTTVPQRFPVPTKHHLPTGPTKAPRRVQFEFPRYKHDATTKKRQQTIREAFIRCWNSYQIHAWLQDELAPVTGGGKTTFGGWAATLVDALDTLWIMDLREDFFLAASAAVQLNWANTTDTSVNLFETTIRHLGGLLGAYDLSGEPALLEKAIELGNMIYMAFDTPNRLPGFWLDFENAKQGLQVAGINDPSASPCSLSLEFTRLAQLTGEDKFYDAISRVTDFLERTQNASKLPGMWPKTINFRNESVNESGFTLGALADSLYEYLPKMSALLGGREPRYERMHRDAMEVVVDHLLFRPMLPDADKHHDILFAGDAFVHPHTIGHNPEGQHLSCFTGGMFALGGKLFDIPEHVGIGERLARGCAWAYDAFPTGLMPEIFGIVPCDSIEGPCPWNEELWQKDGDQMLKKGFANARDPRYILRPEAIESIFLLYRMTGKEELRDIAWGMFESIMGATKTILGNSAIEDVTAQGGTTKLDSMEVRPLDMPIPPLLAC